eukprot:727382-Prymnesium_polylepis.3
MAARVVVSGAPASGKRTLCEQLSATLGLVHLSTGDMLREAVREGTEVGKQAKSFMDAGALVPDELIVKVVKARLSGTDCVTRGWLLDGFPRTDAQARSMQESRLNPSHALLLKVPEAVLLERVTGRRTDPETGRVYHLKFNPPESDEVRTRLQQRADDTEEALRKRLIEFHANNGAVARAFASVATEIDAGREKRDVLADALRVLLAPEGAAAAEVAPQAHQAAWLQDAMAERQISPNPRTVVSGKELHSKLDGHMRVGVAINVLSVHNIDTVMQTFDVEFVLRCRTLNASALRTIEGEPVRTDNWEPRIRFMNQLDTRKWQMRKSPKDGEIDYKYSIAATFSELFEMRSFPCVPRHSNAGPLPPPPQC